MKPKCFRCNEMANQWGKNSGFAHCIYCDLLFRFPMPSDSQIDELYRYYYSKYKIEKNNTCMNSTEYSAANHAKLIKSFGKPGEKVLDFGSGTGRMAWYLKLGGFLVEGVEFSEKAVEYAMRRYKFNFFYSLHHIGAEKDKLFDIITMIEVIEHLKNPYIVLERLYSFLKPGGTIYISTPNRNGINARLYKSKWREVKKPFHLVLFNNQSLTKMLADTGFVSQHPIRFSPLTSPLKKNIVLHRILQALGLFGGLRVIARKPIFYQ